MLAIVLRVYHRLRCLRLLMGLFGMVVLLLRIFGGCGVDEEDGAEAVAAADGEVSAQRRRTGWKPVPRELGSDSAGRVAGLVRALGACALCDTQFRGTASTAVGGRLCSPTLAQLWAASL